MTHFTPVEPEAATGKAAELLAQVQKSIGLTPNMTKVMANSPTLLQSYLALSGAVAGGILKPAVRDRLAIASAQFNGCEYCLSGHTFTGAKFANIDPTELDNARRAESADPHIAALLKLSIAIAENAGDVNDAELQAARDAGVSDAEIGELVANVALNTMTNYFNVLARVENDWPIVTL
ncbi:carboxymuconolactone decarboxylase family protein [Mycolicibacterium sp. CBMA 226]|uniref:carboxymuconolactone decarboxylase family protein n=1 Tax=Mycolicibacterium sp. CBMA 226 TaxID=2606611 RepID=UPI0012DE1EF4|nr:carboxymuconolactone decarboxylase family protein [Mycolicibacterium sp. CBMA 226]MUL75505.1 carboxymuconolactone decarboxylase family protein [Mycolicibacterium sp. CBMA 226]